MSKKDIKKEYLRKRKALMHKQEQLITRHCEPCALRTKNNSNDECSSCKVLAQLQQIGDELNDLSNEKRAQIEKVERGEIVKMLTVERYKQLKAAEVSDKKIMQEFGFHNTAFNTWKRENGLIAKKEDGPQGPPYKHISATEEGSKRTPAKNSTAQTISEQEYSKLKADNLMLLESLEAARSDLLQHKQAMKELEITMKDMQDELQGELYEKQSLLDDLEAARRGTVYWEDKYNESKKELDRIGRLKQLNELLMREWISLNAHSS